MHRSLLLAVLSLSVVLSPLVAAHAAEYTFTTLDFPGASSGTDAYAVNDHGQVVGAYRGAGFVWHGFVYQGGSFAEVAVGSCTQLFVYGINNTGEMVGICQNAAGNRAFFKAPTGEEAIYDAPGATTTALAGINVGGYMAGGFQNAGDPVTQGVFTDLTLWTSVHPPGSRGTMIWGLNASNVMAGSYGDTGNQGHGFTTPDGSSFDFINVPGASATEVFGITTEGQVSGTYYVSGVGHGFVKDGASYTTIDYPGASFTQLRGISPDGTQLTGTFIGASGLAQGFLATRVPIDKTPPVITVAASPTTLSPPNGKRVSVQVSGTITDEDGGSGVKAGSATYVVMDEYDQIEPQGNVALVNGSYVFTVQLPASRNGNDQDGRHYTIVVSAKDNAGHLGMASSVVTVPHH